MQFRDLDIIKPILRALEEEEYVSPTPIQEEAIPVILSGRDLLGCAQTGTGKTAAFAIPTLQLLERDGLRNEKHKKIRALVVTPTRELAIQIYESFCTYGKYTGLRSCVIFGGVSQKPQEELLQQGVDILIATPGRLLDMMNQKLADIKEIKLLILDEADRMLDMGFIHDMKKIIAKTPANRQTLLFSATVPPSIDEMSRTILTNPRKIAVTPVSSTVDTIRQELYYVDKENKKELLIHLLKDKSITSVLIFTRTKHGADRIVRILGKVKINAKAIHGDKSQGARQQALKDFKERRLRILIATDIAARGIDIDELSHVINYDLPNISETYVHRIGRTGRAGMGGTAISFCDFDEKALLADIEKLIGKSIPEVKEHPYPLLRNYPAEKTTQPRRAPKQEEAIAPKSAPKAKGKGTEPERNSSQRIAQKTTQKTVQQNSVQQNSVQQKSEQQKTAQQKSAQQKPGQQKSARQYSAQLKSVPQRTTENKSLEEMPSSGYAPSQTQPAADSRIIRDSIQGMDSKSISDKTSQRGKKHFWFFKKK